MPVVILRFTRKAEGFGLVRRLKVQVDKVTVARLWIRGRFDLQVLPGVHVVRSQMDRLRSPELQVTVGDAPEVVVIEVAAAPVGIWAALVRPRRCLPVKRLGS
jgi:hypothetical protein